MFRSMTAYGRSHIVIDEEAFLIELQSVNRKSLDVTMSLPKEFLKLDIDLRKELTKQVKRGFVTIRITREDQRRDPSKVMPNLEIMQSLYDTCQTYAKALGYNPKEAISFQLLLNYAFSLNTPSDFSLNETFKNQLIDGFKQALSALILMREKEGNALLNDMNRRLADIEKQLTVIGECTQASPKKFREKLEMRLKEFDLLTEEGKERMTRELILFAEKVDVTEELTRLTSHLNQFRSRLSSKKQCMGRELDFLIQEMNREVNTIAAKCQDLEIKQAVLEIKSQQEKIREQVQNIE